VKRDISLYAYDAFSPDWGKDTFLERYKEKMKPRRSSKVSIIASKKAWRTRKRQQKIRGDK
jgi:hypothetical protein